MQARRYLSVGFNLRLRVAVRWASVPGRPEFKLVRMSKTDRGLATAPLRDFMPAATNPGAAPNDFRGQDQREEASSAFLLSAVTTSVRNPGRARSSRFQCTEIDRKSTRLNSSHRCISYAVF